MSPPKKLRCIQRSGRGPFVMNRAEEIRQAIEDYESGKMGHLG